MKPTMTSSRLRPASRRWLAFWIAFLALSATHISACQPVPLSLQWGNPLVCSDTATGIGSVSSTRVVVDLQATQLDATGNPTTVIQIAPRLPLILRIFSQLAFSSDSSRLIPESNFVLIDRIVYFYEYPSNFTLPQDTNLLPKGSPLEQKVYFRIEPKIQANTIGGGQGTAINQDPNTTSDKLLDSFMPPTMASAIVNAQELNSGSQSFEMILNIQAFGTTGWGSKVETSVLRIPVTVCKGCSGCILADGAKLDKCAGLNGKCATESGN